MLVFLTNIEVVWHIYYAHDFFEWFISNHEQSEETKHCDRCGNVHIWRRLSLGSVSTRIQKKLHTVRFGKFFFGYQCSCFGRFWKGRWNLICIYTINIQQILLKMSFIVCPRKCVTMDYLSEKFQSILSLMINNTKYVPYKFWIPELSHLNMIVDVVLTR